MIYLRLVPIFGLDEIFGSQDETRKNNILKALNELSSQFHVEEIKDMLPYVFNVIETADKSSKIIVEGSHGMTLSS